MVKPLYELIPSILEKRRKEFVSLLGSAIKIKSVSSDMTCRHDLFQMSDWLIKELKEVGAQVELRDNPIKDANKKYPPIVLGRLGNDANKKTIMIYNHYDVQPAKLSDGWSSDPFELQEDDSSKCFRGRGTSDDKGPLIAWLCLFKILKDEKIEAPVNFKFCFEGMEEAGSIGLEEFVQEESLKSDGYFHDVDMTLIVDTCWDGNKTPSLCFGLRGVTYFQLEVSGPKSDLHSGMFGGGVQEPMIVLTKLLNSLVNINGEIQIPGIMDQVKPITTKEKELYNSIESHQAELVKTLGKDILLYKSTAETCMAVGRYPSLSIHGVEGAFYDQGEKTVIPHKVIGKFSIRTVPYMEREKVIELTNNYVKNQFENLNSKMDMSIRCSHAGNWWYQEPDSDLYKVAIETLKQVWNCNKVEMMQGGGSIPITIVFEDSLKKPVFLLPMGCGDDGQHSTNEKLNYENFFKGIETYAQFIHHLSEL